MNWLDYVIMIVLIVGAVNGMRRGLVTTVIQLISFVFSITIAKAYYPIMTEFIIKNTDLEEKLMDFIFNEGVPSKLIDIPVGAMAVISRGESINSNINSFVTVSIINAASLILIFIGCSIAFAITQVLLNGISKLPGLNETNKLGGLAIGLLVSVMGLLIFFAILIPIVNIGSWDSMRISIQDSQLAKYFYSYNFILSWILNSAMELIN